MGSLKIGAVFVLYCIGVIYSANTHAIALSQKPLFLTSGAEPNLMFILDDSGSMQFEITPEKYRMGSSANTVFAFPAANGYYGNNAFNTRAVAPGDRSVYGKLFRSKINASYYDPSKRYTPWVAADGSTMPNASPTCALHNPMNTGTGETKCRDLTSNGTRNFAGRTSIWVSCTGLGNCSTIAANTNNSWTYYPATYYWYSGSSAAGQEWVDANYTEVKIQGATSTYTGHGRTSENRTDCNVNAGITVCTYAQEIQNFANWYTYYRSRVLTARAGIGRAFSSQQDDIRVGFGTINRGSNTIDGVSTAIIKTGVRKFDSARKTSFINELYTVPIDGGTPLPYALETVGKYFERADNNGPWSKSPGSGDATAHVACRASYALLMSDGYWTSTVDSVGNADNANGDVITNHTPGTAFNTTYQYKPSAPFADNQSNSLADVAMAYWKKDLRPTLANKVKPNQVDPAFWQHMTTFTIGLGVEGNISPVPNVAESILKGINIPWPNLVTSAEDGTKVDDMVHAAINGRGDFFSASEPDIFAKRLSGLLQDISARKNNNAAAAAANSTSLNTGSVIYNALFDSTNWTGELKATSLKPDGTFGNLLWSASIPNASNRNIYTFNGVVGKEFRWGNLTADQKTALNAGGDNTIGEARLNWVRGVNEIAPTNPADLRSRLDETSNSLKLLGDIVNSDPAYAGTNNMRYDRLPAELGGNDYLEYYNTKKKNRREMIYVGANDGMMHAFNARTSISDAVPAGREMFSYVPTQVIPHLPNLASASYGKDNAHLHRYLVDGPIYISDAYIGGKWRNILVGSLGAGGRGIYVLDVTDPDNFGASNVLFELTQAQYPELGNITRLPVIAPAKDNRWKIFVGNGYNSSKDGLARAYLGVIDIEDEWKRASNNGIGATRTVFIATDGVSESALSQPALLPDPNGYITYAYAGDMRGNLWKFDLSSSSGGSSWKSAYGTTPLFVASRNGVRQPITASPTLGFNSEISPARVMVYFGTGQYVAANDNQPSSDVQSFYAIADKGAVIPLAKNRSSLHQKAIASNSTAAQRYISNEITASKTNAVSWGTVDGWYLDFPANERVITKPLLLFDRLIFPTVIPSEDACESGGSGWFMELIAVGNTNPDYKVLGVNGNIKLNVAIFGQPTSIEGTYQLGSVGGNGGSTSSGSSSSASNDCGAVGGGSGVVAVVGIQSDGTQVSNTGSRPCELFNRQSWQELE